MAVTKLGNSKSAGNSLAYSDKRAVVKSGVNCNPDVAKEQFRATRELWRKNRGIQAHTIIQSFPPGEVTAELANEVGRQLAEKISKGYEVAIFTHADKGHIHNHIIINSVHPETGKKYHSSAATLRGVKEANDDLCREYGLLIASDRAAAMRYTQAEQAIVEKGLPSWKQEIRTAIAREVEEGGSYADFRRRLMENHGIKIDDARKHIVFIDATGHRARGKTLGDDYTRGGIENAITQSNADRERIQADNIGRDSAGTGSNAREHASETGVGGIEREAGGFVGRGAEVRERVAGLTSDGRREAVAKLRAAEEATRRADAERAEANRHAEEQRRNLERQQQATSQPVKQHRKRGGDAR